jgi:DNA processing protein
LSAPLARLTDAQRFDWLRLIRCENVGPRTFRALLAHCGDAAAALRALPDMARRGGASRPLRIAPVDEIERELEAARRLGVRFIALCEPDYPPALRAIDSAPPVIGLRGREEALQQPAAAIVGSRNASAVGLAFTERLARGIGGAGYVIVSGLARGIDQRAHVASLDTGTIAVLAGGHARPYPPDAAPLIERIADYGAILSEMPIEWEPRGRDFPRRNRIVAGLSLATIVVEAARRSGSLITARFANEQGRVVLAVPGSPLDPRAEGANDLLREGATICASVADALGALDPMRARERPTYQLREPPEAGDGALWPELDLPGLAVGAASKAAAMPDEGDPEGHAEGQDDVRARIMALLGPSPAPVDEIARAAQAPIREVQSLLIELELAGRLERVGGARVALLP